ncbi:hypothetical protein IF188_05725 [Microbacterium sp. NEAU-LLC]|uniref:YobI-like P-loop NTPase domain-containing protein n=1 Tax=Microbacterium helvum TaxID=2773713 RepID=A0ABR8NN31_9MICO|nr:hypothetical protein [Microbacterium helvum]MBD3941197.1 hypothetical protein [Microbacterium helvum]
MPDAPLPAVENPITLRSLAPSYDEQRHGVYVTAVVRALREQDDVRNIALTGAYGTGKSSVLRRLTEMPEFQGRVLELSLSTVGVAQERPEGESDTNPAAWTKTNLIQKEIVKQILYRDAPEKTRGSRFRRLSQFRWEREVGVAFGLGALLFVVLWIVGLAAPLMRVLGPDPAAGWFVLANVALLMLLAGVVYAVRWLTHNRVFLEKLSAGPATVSLAATSSSYFDQYMDEIVYYFEKSGRDIVIFEDIDRFEDVHIFETLRALNTLLNGSEQVRRRRRVNLPDQAKDRHRPDIKFIYALRDSVFEKLGDNTDADADATVGEDQAKESEPAAPDQADDEVRRANRTKFFDIVIPIVPFITHRNARDLMLDAMKGTGVSRDLINVAARFVADMRLITDMRNEYDIYASRLLGTPNQMPGLDADRLFAIILYKCVHMADFEAIRFGHSDLDKLHDAWRNIVTDSLADAYDRERTAAKRLALDGVTDARAQTLGIRAELVLHALTPNKRYVSNTYLGVDGQQFRGEELRDRALWERIAGDPPPSAIVIVNPNTGPQLSVTRDQLQTLLGQPLDPTEWQRVDRAAELLAQRSARQDIAFLRHDEWGEMHDRQKYRSRPAGGNRESFADAAQRILRSRLARALVASGYINDYYALYVSIYYGEHLRPQAINYVVHALDRGVADFHYPLDGDDVEAIIGDKGTDIFRDRAAYNINILDHLLSKRPEEAKMIVHQLTALDSEDSKFGEAYLRGGTQRVRFVQLLAPLMPEIILSFVSDASQDILAELVDAALDYAGESIEGPPNDWLIIDHYEQFPSISAAANKGDGLNPRKHRTIDAIAKLGTRLPDTTPLTEIARSRVREVGAYELNATNVEDLTGQSSLALDAIRSKSKAVYRVALDRAGEYLDLVAAREGTLTIEDPNQFISILNEAREAGVNDEQLTQLVRRAATNCHVDDITEVPEQVWPALAATKRMVPSVQNLLAYLDHVGTVDDNIGILLAQVEEISSPAPVSDVDGTRLAVAVLGAAEAIPSPTHRLRLALSLNTPSPLAPASVAAESGDLAGLMIESGLLADDEDTFSSTLIVDWPTRESALARSQNAAAFLSPASLPPAELANFFRSVKVPSAQKGAVFAKLSAFFSGASRDGIRAAATFAVDSNEDLIFAAIDQLRIGGVTDPIIIALLANSTSISLDELRAELRALNDPYPSIADRGTTRPLVPDDDAHRRVLDRLKAGAIVTNHRPERGRRRVYLRRP